MAYKKGFLSTVIDTFAVAISAVVSYKFFEPVAEGAYNLFVRDLVETRFTRVLDDVSASLSMTDKVNAMIEGLPPSAVKLAEAMGVNFGSLTASMSAGGNLSNDALIQLAVDKIGHPIMINITEVITFIAMFVVITIALKFLAGVFKKTNDIPLLGKLNAGLGGVIGIFYNGRAQKKTFYVVSSVKSHGDFADLPRGQGCPRKIRFPAVNAVFTVVQAFVGK